MGIIILEFIVSNTASVIAKFLLDQVTEYKKTKGTNKEIDALNDKLEIYRQKSEFLDKELEQFKVIAEKLELQMGSKYVSEASYVNWNFDIVKPETSAFKVEVWTEKGDFQDACNVAVIPKASANEHNKKYNIGDKINLYFRSEKDCYLTLINYGTSGKFTVLMPNALFQDNFIEGGRIYAIPGQDYPFDYTLSGPSGTEKIKAIATTSKINLLDLAYNKGEIFSTSGAAARDISLVAKNIGNAEPDEWAENLCEFEVS